MAIDFAKLTAPGVRHPFAPSRVIDGRDVGFMPCAVAANDAPMMQKVIAEFICDGVDDNVEIQAAVDALPSGGGKVLLSEGTFNLSAQITRAIDNVSIVGFGRATRLNLDGSTPIATPGTQSGWCLDEFDTDAGGVSIGSGGASVARHWQEGVRTTKVPPLVYTAPTLLNSWVNFGGTWATAGYAKDDQGVVRLKGLLKDGITALGTSIFKLPVGYRPSEDRVFSVATFNGVSLIHARVDVASNGDVKTGVQDNNVQNTWLSLEGISFVAA